MNDRELTELLALHADLLNTGEDKTKIFVEQVGAGSEAAALFQFAARIKAALAPVDARLGFQEQLYRELMQADEQIALSSSGLPGRKVLVGAATVGSLLSLAGFFYWLRRQREDTSFAELSAG